MGKILFGPGGMGPVNEAIKNLEEFNKLGIKACEIEFTYSIYIRENQTEKIREAAKKYGIRLSIHAPYWLNLNSTEKPKIEMSKKRILDCCKIGHLLGARKIVFHPGYYGKMSKEETYENIKREILEMQKEIKKNNWNVELAPETTGKVNVFGSVDEIKKLVEDTGCSFTLDFSHVFARSVGKLSYKEIVGFFRNFDEMHCHFSGIDFGDKGEKKHIRTTEKMWKELLNELSKKKEVVIINESPYPVEDSVLGMNVLNSLKTS